MSRSLTIYPGAAETQPCPYGAPLPDIPTNFAYAGGTGSGKSIALLNNLCNHYMKGGTSMFARIFFFSPSIYLDPQYKVIRDMLEKMTDQKREKTMFESFDQSAVEKILDDQRAIVESCRKRKVKAPQICIVLDDLGDQADVLTNRRGAKAGGSWMTTLACRGRHLCVTWMVTVQKLNQLGLTIRANLRNLAVWRLRNNKEIEILCEELSGYYDRNIIHDLYMHATEEPYSFLFCRLDAKTRADVFWLRFESRLSPQSEDTTNDVPGVPAGGPLGSGSSVPLAKQRPGQKSVGPERIPDPAAGKGVQARGKNPNRENPRVGKGPLPAD